MKFGFPANAALSKIESPITYPSNKIFHHRRYTVSDDYDETVSRPAGPRFCRVHARRFDLALSPARNCNSPFTMHETGSLQRAQICPFANASVFTLCIIYVLVVYTFASTRVHSHGKFAQICALQPKAPRRHGRIRLLVHWQAHPHFR